LHFCNLRYEKLQVAEADIEGGDNRLEDVSEDRLIEDYVDIFKVFKNVLNPDYLEFQSRQSQNQERKEMDEQN